MKLKIALTDSLAKTIVFLLADVDKSDYKVFLSFSKLNNSDDAAALPKLIKPMIMVGTKVLRIALLSPSFIRCNLSSYL
jgi:hypothetical protein